MYGFYFQTRKQVRLIWIYMRIFEKVGTKGNFCNLHYSIK